MHVYRKIYEFASSAGAFEGYVYRRKHLDQVALPVWADNLVTAYRNLPSDVTDKFQTSLDSTLGRAVRSLMLELGEEHEVVQKIKSMVLNSIPASSDDFQKQKWFQK